MADGSAPKRPEDPVETERWEADKRRTAGGAPKPYTAVAAKGDLTSAIWAAMLRRLAKDFGCRPEDLSEHEVRRFEEYAGVAQMAALTWLAEAGRLRPDGELYSRGVDYASEHAGHTVDGLADPFIQPTGSDRALAELRVRAWSKRPGVHRLVSRDVATYIGPWTPVDAALQDRGSDG